MSIIAYVGLPGSGKSFDVVANQILPALSDGRRVVTNIPLNRDVVREKILKGEIVELPLDKIAQQPELIDEYATNGCVLVIDEVWRLWPAGWKADKIPQAFKSLLAEHRHKVDSEGRSMQIVLVTQDLAQISAFARQLVEQTFHHTKLTHVGMRGSYRIDVFHGAVTGAVPPINNRLREIFGKYSPAIFKMYKSQTMSDSLKHGTETALDHRGNFFRRPVIYLGAVGAIAGLYFGFSTLADIASDYGAPDLAVGESRTAVEGVYVAERKNPPVVPSSRPPAPVKQSISPYKIVGYIRMPDDGEGSVALLSDGKLVVPVPWNLCAVSAEGETRCRFRGRVIGEFGAL